MERERNLPRLCLLFIVSYFVFCYINKEVSAAVCTAEEGKPHNGLTCTNPNKDKYVRAEVLWKRSTTGNDTETVAICRNSRCNIIGINDRFFNASLVNGTSTLTIKNVSRFEPFNMTTNWTCKWSNEPPKTVCEPLHVVVQPEKPTCVAFLHQGLDGMYNVTCITQRVYPPAKCDVSSINIPYRTLDVSYKHTMLARGRYYRSECQLTIKDYSDAYRRSYSIKDPRSTSFFVRMYPGWRSGSSYRYSHDSQAWWMERVLRSDETTTTTTTTQQPLTEAATTASSVEGDATEPGGYSPATVICLAVLLFIMTAVAITLGILMYLVRRGRRQPKTLPPPSPPVTQPQPPQLPQPPQQDYDGMEMAQKDDAEGHVYEGVKPRDTDAGFEEDGLVDKSTYGNVKMSQSTKEDGQTDKSTYGNVKTSKKSNK